MARAYNIWVVEEFQNDEWFVIKAFTVKHELISFLNRHTEPETDNFNITRVSDGSGPGNPKQLTVKELMES